jgi:toxin ParE1/3/4
MDKYSIKLNQQAFKDIESIFAYIALEKLAPENGKRQTDRIWKRRHYQLFDINAIGF